VILRILTLRVGPFLGHQVASLAVVADAKDDLALTFYRKFGFTLLGSDPNRVFLAMGTVAQLVNTSK
jgi:hypothetical protein